MPLIKSTSKQAFAKNVKTELSAGRPLKQSLAIAYSQKREAGRKSSGEHHSAHSQKRSRHYHSNIIEATAIGHGATKMTRQEAVRGKNEEAWDR